MEDLFNPVSILLHILNAGVLFVALYFLLYKPVAKFMQARSDQVRAQLDEAQRKADAAEAALDQSRQRVRDAEQEAAQVGTQGAQDAQKRAQEIVDAANIRAQEIINAANREADILKRNAKEAAADTVAALAVEIAAKILSREVSAQDNARLIDEFIKKVE